MPKPENTKPPIPRLALLAALALVAIVQTFNSCSEDGINSGVISDVNASKGAEE